MPTASRDRHSCNLLSPQSLIVKLLFHCTVNTFIFFNNKEDYKGIKID